VLIGKLREGRELKNEKTRAHRDIAWTPRRDNRATVAHF